MVIIKNRTFDFIEYDFKVTYIPYNKALELIIIPLLSKETLETKLSNKAKHITMFGIFL